MPNEKREVASSAGKNSPADGTDIVVYGVFNTYEEEGNTYCQLKNARLESQS